MPSPGHGGALGSPKLGGSQPMAGMGAEVPSIPTMLWLNDFPGEGREWLELESLWNSLD